MLHDSLRPIEIMPPPRRRDDPITHAVHLLWQDRKRAWKKRRRRRRLRQALVLLGLLLVYCVAIAGLAVFSALAL
jgi:hypothetical protein